MNYILLLQWSPPNSLNSHRELRMQSAPLSKHDNKEGKIVYKHRYTGFLRSISWPLIMDMEDSDDFIETDDEYF